MNVRPPTTTTNINGCLQDKMTCMEYKDGLQKVMITNKNNEVIKQHHINTRTQTSGQASDFNV
jgi:hypothetical protein